jgi:site-specific DNA recombinase
MRAASPKSAAIYARISNDPSGARLGVRRQEADCLEEARRRGWSIAEVYVDDDLSAFNTKKPRPEYQRLLSDIQLGRRDGVMIWRLDRLHRQPRELEEFIVLCDKHEVALATVTGDVDLATSQGRLLARTWGAFAAHECEIKSERQRRANLERARQGVMPTNWRPYGFKNDGITIKPEEAAVIKEAAGRVLRGESLRGICIDFNRRGIKSASRIAWQTAPLRRILRNPRVAGLSTYYGEIVGKGAWPRILTSRQSDQLRALLSDPERRTRESAHIVFLMTGLLRCGRCGERMKVSRNAKKRSYSCARQPGTRGCGRVSIDMADLDACFRNRLYARLDSPALAATLQRARLSDPKWRKARSVLDAAESRLRQMARDYAIESLTRSEWRAARPALIERVNAMRAALLQDRAETVVIDFVGHADQLRAAWDDLTPNRRHAIASALVAEVVIWPAANTRPHTEDRALIWWRDEPRPRTPRGARKGLAERRAAGDFNHCSVTSCPEPYASTGYCNIHLRRFRKCGDAGTAPRQRMAPYRGALCSSDGCDRRARAIGRCGHHYEEWVRDDPNRRRCPVAGCGRSAQVGKWCARHYQRLARTGTTDLQPRPPYTGVRRLATE